MTTGARRPPKRPDPTTEERPDIRRDEARICERILQARLIGLPTKIVAIIENIVAGSDVLEQRLDMTRDRLARAPQVLVRILLPQRGRVLHGEPGRDVA